MTADQLAQLLDELGKRLSPAAEHVWGIVAKQVVIEGIFAGAVGLLGIAALIVFVRLAKKWLGRKKGDYEDSFDDVMGLLIGGIPAVIVLVITLFALSTATTNLLNPEYAVLVKVLGAIK